MMHRNSILAGTTVFNTSRNRPQFGLQLLGALGMAKDTPFGQGTRIRVLKDYLAQAGEITEANAWEHVYRCLLWFDIGASLAHIYRL